jgi:prevent-host-death family protein
MAWQLAEAKNTFSEFVNKTRDDGPQFLTRRDEEYVLLTKKEYLRLTGAEPNFIEHLLNIPKSMELDLTRDKSPMRDVEW